MPVNARICGINLDTANAWHDDNDLSEDWIFGPDPNLDNVWQNTPQVNLHGMDEGLVMKLNYGALLSAIEEANSNSNVSATKVKLFFMNPTYLLPLCFEWPLL